MRSVLLACLVALAATTAAGCGDQSGCLPAIPGTPACPDGTFVDASTTDPICLSNGAPQCRGDNATCYVCTGTDFPDNCTVTAPQQTIECVHACAKC